MSRIGSKKYLRALASFGISFSLLFAAVFIGLINNSLPILNAKAQEADEETPPSNGAVYVSFEYVRNLQYYGDKQYARYTGTATLTPTDGGFEGIGTGSYEGHDELPPFADCTEPQLTKYAGTADLIVNAQYSIDNSVTGGPDTSMYNSSTSVIELIVSGDNISAESTGVWDGSHGCTTQSWISNVGFDCHFYGIDFSIGGTYQKPDEDDPTTTTCSISVTPVAEDFRVFGTVKSLAKTGTVPISNSRVVIAKIDDKSIDKLSVSKPHFFDKTATTEDQDAKYEFKFGKEAGKLPRVLVVSLLWYEGKPEFAITNGKNVSGIFIPVYQAVCVDDSKETECMKWRRTGNGTYEAQVDFLYGSQQKLDDIITFMELEDWEGSGTVQGVTMVPTAVAYSTGLAALIQKDSGYMYYQSYRAAKYLKSLGLATQQPPVMIKSHHIGGDCTFGSDDAWYDFVQTSYGGLGTLLDPVSAKGGGIYICDNTSRVWTPDAPVNREWHELGHYLLYMMHAPTTPYTGGDSHKGYSNNSTNESYIEGFAEFFAMLVNEYYGNPSPYLYTVSTSVVDTELNIKPWGGAFKTGPSLLDEEFAMAGTLWDFHDRGTEIGLGFMLNGTLTQPSKIYSTPKDEVSLDAKKILQVLERNKSKNAVEIYDSFVGATISQVDLDMIFMDHGFFADVIDRNFVHDSTGEKIPETGSKSSPARMVRHSPVPTIPGSYIMVDSGVMLNVTVQYSEPLEYSSYSYLVNASEGEPFYFIMPPKYYPSTAFVTPVSSEGEPLSESVRIESDEYWNYINSGPPHDGVFRQLSVNGQAASETSTIQYIQIIKDSLGKASSEYSLGNVTGAEDLAVMAYNDYYDHLKTELDQRNATELSVQTERMLSVDLAGLIRDREDQQSVDDKIAEINSKLDEAIVIVPEFPVAGLGGIAAVGVAAVLGRDSFRKR